MKTCKVIDLRDLTDATYILRFERNGINFSPGQYLVIGLPGDKDAREYSVYSGKEDAYLEILVRRVERGMTSVTLHDLKPGDLMEVKGPYGFFLGNVQPPGSQNLLFIASGTGIAPFHSFVRTFPEAKYRIIHGIRTIEETYGKESYKPGSYISCTSRDIRGDHPGHLTNYLKEFKPAEDTIACLCGNSNMIFEAVAILKEKGLPNTSIFTEIYF